MIHPDGFNKIDPAFKKVGFYFVFHLIICKVIYINILTKYIKVVYLNQAEEGGVKMSKSVYSLVLNDEVINEIDRLAYVHSTNRSNMINQILAEYVSVETPEQKVHDIFNRMEALLLHSEASRNAFQLQGPPSDTMFSLRSALAYKYNPRIRYRVELYKHPEGDIVGELKVWLRTQNGDLIQAVNSFYSLWTALEKEYFPDVETEIVNERYTRKLKLRENLDRKLSENLTLGDVIASYINTFDIALKTCFESDESSEKITEILNDIYRNYLKGEAYV